MPEKSLFQVDIPSTDLLTWLFPPNSAPSDRPIWIDADNPDTRSLSPRQLLQWVKRLGYGLNRLHLQQNDVVMVFSTNHIFFPVAYLGIAGHGYVFSGCNPAYGVAEIKYQIENTGAKLLLVEPLLLPKALEAATAARFPRDHIYLFSDELCQKTEGFRDWRQMIGSVEEVESTTGLPKGVMISHRNIIANTLQCLYMRRLNGASPHSLQDSAFGGQQERWLGFLPLYHAYGQLWSQAAAAKSLTPCYFMRTFNYRRWLEHIQNFKITHIQTAPPVVVMLGKRPETREYDISSLKNILCGAAPLSRELQNEVMTTVGKDLRIAQTWGMTEVTCCGFHVPGLMHDLSGAVGLIDPNCEVKLISDDGNEVGDGERGEICMRGPNVCLGYWRNEEATRSTFDQDGFLKTGDVAVKKDGWYWIVDRKKELIKVRGFQVAPAELEAVLLEHEDVGDSAVVALHIHHEELPRAYVTLKDHAKGRVTEEGIVKWTASKVARHKQLTGGVVFIDEVPKSPSGKIQRKVLRDWANRAVQDRRSATSKL